VTTFRPDEPLAFDPVELRRRYSEEREKRLLSSGNQQYKEVSGDLAHFDADPHSPIRQNRDPLTDRVEVLIVGAGFSGLLAAARLRQVGVTSIRVIDDGADAGGTWYWNRYPGAQCDIESYIYLPLLEELGYMPTEKYSHGPEIQAHAHAIAEHFGLMEDACFQTRVTSMRWDDAATAWVVSTDRGDRMYAQFVIMAIGPLSRPKLPGIPGIEDFNGHSFHTSRWDYDYTGGDTNGSLTKLSERRVGVIGTGATGVQCIPHLGEWAKSLFVFQRTPSSIDVRRNQPTDSEWVASLTPGWQQRRIDNFGVIVAGGHQEEDLVADGWTEILGTLSGLAGLKGEPLPPEEMAARMELADFAKMEQIRTRIDSFVRDPTTAEALKPWYRQFCKRPCFHDDYLTTFNRPNVTLVDTHGRGVERITKGGVVVEGTEYPLDCLIFATGFEVGTAYTRRAGCDLEGRDRLRLSEKWGEKTATFHGYMSRGFPNCFFMGGIQSGISPNFTELYNEQSLHVAYVVESARRSGARRVEPTEAAEQEWLRTLESSSQGGMRFQEQCTPGYYNNEGRPNEGPGWFGGTYGGGSQAFFAILRNWRSSGDLAGLELT
jgi:cyclohexanone monooxygenase